MVRSIQRCPGRGISTAPLALAAALTAAVWAAPAQAGEDAAASATPLAQTAPTSSSPSSSSAPAQPPQPPASPPPMPPRPDGLPTLRLDHEGDALLLSAQLGFALPPAVRDALGRGVPVYFIAEAEIVRPRWYWKDQRLGQARRYWRLNYLPLTRRWRLSSSLEPMSEAGVGTGLAQHYDNLDDAVAALRRITRWRIADDRALEGSGQSVLLFSFWLDTAQLPRALQIGATGQADWHLRIERRIDLNPRDIAP